MKVILNKAQYDYLKNNNILEKYKTNIENNNSEVGDYDFSKVTTFISCSFIWGDTKEGNKFWHGHNLLSYGLESNELKFIEL